MKPPKRTLTRIRWALSITTLLTCFAPMVIAGDWPQIHGPHRNGVADGETIASAWGTPPRQRWAVKVGEGYAGPAVVGEQVFVFHRQQDQDRLDCLAVEDGSVQWTASWRADYRGGIDADRGPRCVPVVHDGRVYVWTAGGSLHCVATDGNRLWTRKLAADFDARDGYFGFGSTPLAVGDLVLVNVGGRPDAAVVALDAKTGADRWKQGADDASYASPIAWSYRGKPCAVFITRLNLLGLDVNTGAVLFQTAFGARGPTVNAAAPLALDQERLFVTASYRIGAKLLHVTPAVESPSTPRIAWENDRSLSSQYPTPIYADGHLYGIHGREDGPAAALRCIDAATGEVLWTEPQVGMAHLILADDKLLMLRTDGALVLLKKSASAYVELGRHRVSSSTTRALPALSRGRIYIRSVDGQLAAWQLPTS